MMIDICAAPAPIDEANLIIEKCRLDGQSLIASGNDSKVYRVGECTVKLYRVLDPSILDEYLTALPAANRIVRSYVSPRPIVVFGRSFEIAFDAIDVRARGVLDGCTYTISSYSPYPNLDVLSAPKTFFDQYVSRYLQSTETGVVEFLRSLNSHFLEERPTRLFDEFIYMVDELSRILDERLGHKGHYIGKYNAKVVPNLSARRICLLITDTAVYIERTKF